MMKKRIMVVLVCFIALVGVYFFGSALARRTDVMIGEYSLSEDHSRITFDVAVASSMGYVGSYSVKQEGSGLYITFRSTIGGINSPLGAGNQVSLELPADCDGIYFYAGNKGFVQKLKKNNTTQEWERANMKSIIYD